MPRTKYGLRLLSASAPLPAPQPQRLGGLRQIPDWQDSLALACRSARPVFQQPAARPNDVSAPSRAFRRLVPPKTPAVPMPPDFGQSHHSQERVVFEVSRCPPPLSRWKTLRALSAL